MRLRRRQRASAVRGGARFNRAQGGVTLTELMVSLVIIAVGILSLGRLFILSQRHAYYGRAETMAVSLATEIREKILSDNFDDVKSIFDDVDTSIEGTVTLPCAMWAQHVTDELGTTGRGEIQVYDETEDAEIVAGMVTVLITIFWTEAAVEKSVDVRFSVSKMGV